MRSSPIRRRWVLLAAVGTAVVVVVVLLAQYSAHRTRAEPAIAAAALPTATAQPQGFPPATLDPRADLSSSPDHVEICGVGWVKKGPAADAIHKAADETAAAALDAAYAALIAKGNPAERAVAMYAQRADLWIRTMLAGASCGEDAACMAAAWDRAQDAVKKLPQSLLSDGLATIDPKIYALAFYACSSDAKGNNKEAECAQYSAARWAQLDPGNAMAWLHVATDASRRGDAAALEEALRRASKASYSSQHVGDVVSLLDQPAIQGLDPAARFALTLRLSVVSLSAPWPDFHPLVQACTQAATHDAGRRQMCSDLAQVFTERSNDLLTFSIGTTLGERAGWPPNRVAALRERKDAISQVSSRYPGNPERCDGMQQFQLRMEGMLREGELASAQHRIGKTGRTTAELAREWRAANPPRPL